MPRGYKKGYKSNKKRPLITPEADYCDSAGIAGTLSLQNGGSPGQGLQRGLQAKRKTASGVNLKLKKSDSVGIRTQDPQLRRLLLYPTELRNHPLFGVAKLAIILNL